MNGHRGDSELYDSDEDDDDDCSDEDDNDDDSDEDDDDDDSDEDDDDDVGVIRKRFLALNIPAWRARQPSWCQLMEARNELLCELN